jgi:hypothetical protein
MKMALSQVLSRHRAMVAYWAVSLTLSGLGLALTPSVASAVCSYGACDGAWPGTCYPGYCLRPELISSYYDVDCTAGETCYNYICWYDYKSGECWPYYSCDNEDAFTCYQIGL